MIKIALTKEIATVALETYLNTLVRKQRKEHNTLICELLDKDIAIIRTAINTITDAK